MATLGATPSTTTFPATAADVPFVPAGTIAATNVQAAIEEVATEAGGSGAPADAQYLVAASHAGLSAEVVATAAGLALLDDADASAQRTTLGLGTAAVAATGDFEAAGAVATHAAAGDPHTGYQLESGLAAAITATKLDDFTAPDDNTDLNVSTTKHGLTPKLPNDATKFLDGTGAFSVPAGGGSVTKRVPIALDTPDASGNAYPGLTTNNGFTRPRRVIPYFTKDVLGTWEGAIRVPADYASAGKVVCSFVGNATSGVFRSIVSTSVVAAAAAEDVAYTDETAVDTTFATTANRRVDVSVTLTTTPAAGSTLNVKITHDGANANDTIAVDVGVWHVEFEYTT